MEFITAEQFKEQPVEVQKVFLDWWKPSDGDIYLDVYMNNNVIECCHHIKFMDNVDVNNMKEDKDAIPLFTEGQLRKFIEDKTGGILVASCNVIGSRLISIVKKDKILDGFKTIRRISFKEGIDLLEVYWKVACSVAEEEVDG